MIDLCGFPLSSVSAFGFKEYQHCFHQTKQKLKQDPSEKQFEFSEMYIFGKFETFHCRLAKILDIFTTLKTYSVLQDCKIEGLEDMATKYQVLHFKMELAMLLYNRDFDTFRQ